MDFRSFVGAIIVVCAISISVGREINLCREDYGFSSLEECQISCYNLSRKSENESSYDFEEVQDDEFNEDEDRMFAYKSIFLTSKEYNITTNESLQTNFGNFDSKDYFKKGDWIIICFPTDKSLHFCKKLITPLDKIELIEENHGIRIEKFQKSYTTDLFSRNLKREILTCRPRPNLSLAHNIAFWCSAAALAIALFASFTMKIFRNERNWPLTAHIAMLFLAYMTINFKINLPINFVGSLCQPFALFQMFFFLSAFFWVNVQAFLVHSAFTKLQGSVSVSAKARYRKFLTCGAFAWGIALFIVLVTLIVEKANPPILKPPLSINCWFNMDEVATSFLYYYGPMAISLLLNLVLFLHIVIHVRKLAHDASAVNKAAYKQLLCLAMKLVIILGFCWIIKIASWSTGVYGDVLPYLDLLTSFQGVFISVAYLVNKSVFKELKSVCLKIMPFHKNTLSRKEGDINMSTQTVVTVADSSSSH